MNEYDIHLPSGRILFALKALKEFESTAGCSVDMKRFHKYEADTCFVCLGAAAALKHYDIIENDYRAIDDIADLAAIAGVEKLEVAYFERSLDSARVGWIASMFDWMNLPPREGHKFDRDITDYHEDREEFYADMYQLAEDLKAGGY